MMFVPVDVPADAKVHTVGEVFRVQEGHPYFKRTCPVCIKRIGPEPLILVYVGVEPDNRRLFGTMQGSAVVVHVLCTDMPSEENSDDQADGGSADSRSADGSFGGMRWRRWRDRGRRAERRGVVRQPVG